MRKPAILITGANGEIGHGLITALHNTHTVNIITLDLNKLDSSIAGLASEELIGNILDENLIEQLNGEYEFSTIYHLAALLSTRAESSPRSAHDVNVGGTLNLLNLALEQGRSQGNPIKFFFPSSIAVYGLKTRDEKQTAGIIPENRFLNPVTMYGCNKLYCEHLGSYYSQHYQRLGAEEHQSYIDFRSIRFPGIISSHTIPTGGTSDYIPEMLHAAARGTAYKCFVQADSQIPFMTMPDAVQAILDIMVVPMKNLNQTVYNIRAFAPTADEFRQKIISAFPNAKIKYDINEKRQNMVDSWPSDTDDSAARDDWNWNPRHDLETGMKEYLVPNMKKIYK
jgi:nucleoside-diphosphate-sugar epimerase